MARTPMRGQASGTSLREQCCFSVLVNRMLRPWPGKIDSAFIGKRRRSRQFYPLAAFGAAAALGISIGVPGLPPHARNRRQFPVVWIDRQAPPALSTPILAIPGQAGGRSAVLPGFAQPIALPLPRHLKWRLSISGQFVAALACPDPMNLRIFRTPAAFLFSTVLLASYPLAQTTHPAAPESPYGGATVEEIIARVNDQIITRSDYDRASKELDEEARQHGATEQQISEAQKDLLRNQIDQQLWLSKGKELGITGETGLINRLDEIRKQYHLESLEDLEKAAKEQGVSFEDFKANIRNGVITQEVMREELGKLIQFTPGEAERYFEEHKQEFVQPENVTLAEILVSTGTPAPSVTGGVQPDDPAKLAATKAKADDIEAKLHAGGDFGQLARTFSDGSTAAEGGDLGQYKRGELAKVFEDQTFALKAGQFTEPIRTKQGFVIMKVVQHIPGGVPTYKDVEAQVQENFFAARMEPAMRGYLTTMREQAFIDIKPGYTDTGASAKQTKPIYSAYTPPAPKKKKKVERTRFRESTRTFRQKTSQAAAAPEAAAPAATHAV